MESSFSLDYLVAVAVILSGAVGGSMAHDCSAWNKNCAGCLRNFDTNGWVNTNCQYCPFTGQCSGTHPKPPCGGAWIDHGGSCAAPPPPKQCNYDHNCQQCLLHSDTTGLVSTNCQYCPTSGKCSGETPKPFCGVPWRDHGESCTAAVAKRQCDYDNNCQECVKHYDTSGFVTTQCQYCPSTGRCSGIKTDVCPKADWMSNCMCNFQKNCKECIKHTDTSGLTSTPCVYCASSGECSGSQFSACMGGQWSQGCGKDALPYLNLANAVLNAGKCVATGMIGTFNSMTRLVQAVTNVESATNAISIDTVCNYIVGKLQGSGQSKMGAVCKPDDLCTKLAVLGPEGPVACQLVFIAICMENSGNTYDPCGWLMKQITGGNDNVCKVLGSTVGGLTSANNGH